MPSLTYSAPAPEPFPPHPRVIGWPGTTAMAMGGCNQSLFLIGALISAQGSAAIPILIAGLALSWAAMPGWTELIMMWPKRIGGISASCAEAFRPYSPVLANLTGTCYWWGWVPTCGLTALLSASALHQWYFPRIGVKVLAAAIVVAFTVANLAGLRRVTRLALAIAGGSAVLAFLSAVIPVWAGKVDWHRATNFHLISPFHGAFGGFTSAMAGLYLVGFAAPAFEAAANHVGETYDAERNVPRAMFASAGMATLYFAVLPVLWLGVLGPHPLAGELARTLGPTFAPLLGGAAKGAAIWFMVLNMFHGTLTPVTGVARTLSQLSEDGLLPRILARRSSLDVPWVASLVTAVFAIGFLLAGDPVWLIAAANFTYLIGISLPSVAVWLLRRNEPGLPRPYRARKGMVTLGLIAAVVWGVATIFGFEQFGLPTVLIGLALAYSGALAYVWRQWRDRGRQPRRVKRPLGLKLTSAMLGVLLLDGAGYLMAVSHVVRTDAALITGLQDIFVAVAVLTVTAGLVMPGMIAHAATEVAGAADRLVRGTLADLTRAMQALADGDLEAARARVENRPVSVHSADEVGAMARSFNVILEEAARAASSLDAARAALQNHRESIEAHSRQQKAVADLGRVALVSSDLGEVAIEAAATIARTLGLPRAALFRADIERGVLQRMAVDSTGWPPASMQLTTEGVLSVALGGAGPVPMRLTEHGLAPARADEARFLWLTISVRNRPFGGVLVQLGEGVCALDESELSFLESVANVVGSAAERIEAERELNYQALHDDLTGLPNRALLIDRLAQVLARLRRRPATVAVLFVDVDHFKVVNDSLGHEQGDRLLIAVGQRLVATVRPGDTVARFGGDEFVVLCEDLADAGEAELIAERIRSLGEEPVFLADRQHFITVSTGIAHTSDPSISAGDLLRDADSAMYQAKEAGRGRTVVFAELMRTRAVRRLETELSLRRAITEGELRVAYQPIVGLADGRPVALEALVRWDHPKEGVIPPDDFIPIAEETGLIVPLGEWLLGEACRQIATWNRQFGTGLSVSVNLSGRQIGQSDVVQTVRNILLGTGAAPASLVLEITESVLMRDAEAAIAVLRRLRDLGVRLSIDDFGTGYSSLTYLKRFPVDVLKIDRTFVDGLGTDAEDTAIVRATVSMAEALGLETVAEGVETDAQARTLVDLGCFRGQGFHFAAPQSAPAITEWLDLALARVGQGQPTKLSAAPVQGP